MLQSVFLPAKRASRLHPTDGGSKVFLILVTLPLTTHMVREGSGSCPRLAVVGPRIPARARGFGANINFRSKNSDIEREAHKARKNSGETWKIWAERGEKRNEHFAAGGNALTGGPTMTRKGDLSWGNLTVLRTSHGCRMTWATHRAGQQTRGFVTTTRNQR